MTTGPERPPSIPAEKISPLARLLVASCVVSSMAFAGPQSEAQEKPTGAALADLLAKFDTYDESSRLRFSVPGMAIAVIQGKSVVFSKGYGARVQGEPATVNTSPVFQIGSISKSFTAAVMGSLVDEGKAAFEDHVIDRYPSFQMYDPWVTREFMIWDLMAQHSGLAPYAGDSAVTIGFTRQDFVNGCTTSTTRGPRRRSRILRAHRGDRWPAGRSPNSDAKS